MGSEKRQAALTALGAAMHAYGAWDPRPAIPAFIPIEAIEDLAARLAPKSQAQRRALSQRLRSEAPAMARAWCERVRRTPVKGSTPRILEFIDMMEALVHTEFHAELPERKLALGSEFEILHRERPDLTQEFLRELSRAHAIDARSKS